MTNLIDIIVSAGIELKSYRQGEHRAPCPECAPQHHKPRDPVLAVKIDDRGVTWKCHRCGWDSKGRGAAKREGTGSGAYLAINAANEQRKVDGARELWGESVPIKGTLGETYFRNRGIGCELPPHCLRFHKDCWHSDLRRGVPAVIAKMVDIKTNEGVGIHRTYLRPDGGGKLTDVTAKKMFGRASHTAIKLTPDEDVTLGLAITEGVENGLTMLGLGFHVWALGSAGAIAKFPVLAGIEALTIFADMDEAGLKAANECAERWSNAGVEVAVTFPKTNKSDWNDEVRHAVA